MATKKYRARWYDAAGTQRQKRFTTAAGARDYQRRMKIAAEDGINIDHERRRTPLHMWVNEHLDRQEHHLAELTVRRYRGVARNQITATDLGQMTLGAIRPTDVELWTLKLSTEQHLAPRSVKKALDLLSASLNAAVRDGILTTNPCQGVKPPSPQKAEMLWLTPDEVELVAGELGWRGDVVRFLAYTGLRWGECRDLTVGDVYWPPRGRGRLQVRKAKTEAGHRSVPIAAPIDELARARVKGRGQRDLVWSTPRGARMRNSNFRDAFKRALARAGLNEAVRIHDLRHSCATWLIGNGAEPVTVSHWLGHASVSITLDTYTHLWPDKLDEAAGALEGLGGGGVGRVTRLDDHRREDTA